MLADPCDVGELWSTEVLCGAMMVSVGGLCRGIVLGKGLIVAMMMSATICADFRLKYGLYRLNGEPPKAQQHLFQNWIQFQLQILWPNLQLHMTVTQVIRRPEQSMGIRRSDTQECLVRGDHLQTVSCRIGQKTTMPDDDPSGKQNIDGFLLGGCDGTESTSTPLIKPKQKAVGRSQL